MRYVQRSNGKTSEVAANEALLDATTTPDPRQRLIDKAAATGLLARVLAIAANFGTVPLVMSALGTDGFGVWAAITSVLTMMLFLDFGIGNSAMNRITEALAHEDHAKATVLVRHTYIVLSGITVAVLLTCGALYAGGALHMLARHSGSFLASHVDLTVGFVLCYAVVIPASFVQRLLSAHQRGGSAATLQLAFSLSYLMLAALATWLAQGLLVFVLGYVLLMALVYGSYSLYFLKRRYPAMRLRGSIERQILFTLIKDAGLFFLLQTTVSAVYNSDIIILSSVASAEEVAIYATTWRMFALVPIINGLILGPFWPAVSDAKARNDWAWIKAAYRHNLKRSMLASFGLVTVLVGLGNALLEVWTGGRVQAPLVLLLLMGMWVLLEGYGQCMAMLLNGLHILRLQLAVAALLLVLGISLKLYLTHSVGLYGPVLGTIIAFVLIVCISETFFIYHLLKKS